MDCMTNSFFWIVKLKKSQPQLIQNYYQALLRFDFHIWKSHEYDRIQNKSWKEARVEVPTDRFEV